MKVHRRLDKTTKIDDNYRRNQTFQKRKRGILKKAIELANLCGQ